MLVCYLCFRVLVRLSFGFDVSHESRTVARREQRPWAQGAGKGAPAPVGDTLARGAGPLRPVALPGRRPHASRLRSVCPLFRFRETLPQTSRDSCRI